MQKTFLMPKSASILFIIIVSFNPKMPGSSPCRNGLWCYFFFFFKKYINEAFPRPRQSSFNFCTVLFCCTLSTYFLNWFFFSSFFHCCIYLILIIFLIIILALTVMGKKTVYYWIKIVAILILCQYETTGGIIDVQ